MEDFTYDYVSVVDHEHLVVEAYYRGQRLFQLSKEAGGDSVDIELIEDKYILDDQVHLKFSLSSFLTVIQTAKLLLDECP